MKNIAVTLKPNDHLVHKALVQLCQAKKVNQFIQLALSRFLQTKDGQEALLFLTCEKQSKADKSKAVPVRQQEATAVAPAKEVAPIATPDKVATPEGGQEYKKISLDSLFKQPASPR